jgi:hypothetical protein
MEISFLRTDGRVLSSVPVQLLLVVDRKIVRAAIDWATLRHFIGDDSNDEALVRDFIRKNRQGIELAIKAHLFAHGVPLDRQLVLTSDDFNQLHPV